MYHRWVALLKNADFSNVLNIGLTSDLNGGGVSSLHLKLLNIKIYIYNFLKGIQNKHI